MILYGQETGCETGVFFELLTTLDVHDPASGVAGDFVETGSWRGGHSIFARGVQR